MNIYDELKSAYGNYFQDLFSKLMKEKYGMRYKSTSTYGNIGDMGVDGVLDFNTAFAVYAPEIYNDKKTIEKINKDFENFLNQREKGQWKYIQKYIFVIKRERNGVTSTVLNQISEFKHTFPVDIMTLDDLLLFEKQYLPFSEDGKLLEEFKEDVTSIMEYIIDTDFAAEPFKMSFPDDIKSFLKKWKQKKYIFKKKELKILKKQIFEALYKLYSYLAPGYVHAISEERLLFSNTSEEEHERFVNVFCPDTLRIRKDIYIYNLLEKLYSIN